MKNKVRLPDYIKPERYKIMLKPDLDQFSFTGEETIYLSLEKPVKEITLHSIDLEIDSAEFTHNGKEIWAGKISYDKKSETATFTFPKKLKPGKGQLKLNFRGLLNDKMRGFYKSKFEIEGQEKHLATTQFEATDARRAFPCFDEPAKKAIFDVTLMIPAHLNAISNTIESNVLEHESGYKIVEFAPTPQMSTYLLAFIVGEFEYIEGRTSASSLRKSFDPEVLRTERQGSINIDSRVRGNDNGILVRVFTTPGKKDQAKFALSTSIKCLEFYNDYFGIDYPLPVLDLIAIPDFAAGAMENWGAVTYRESTLLIDEERSSTGNKQWVALVIAHELAHQWFGNLVTMEWWSDLWLNEGFASFIEYLAIDSIFPTWDIWTQFVNNEMGEAFALDALENTHPIQVEVHHPSEISEIFDKVSYSKGASVLRMLWEYLGERDFQKGLQYYLKKYQYSNARTKNLWEALEEVSGKPVVKLMANWTLKPGHPVIAISEHGSKLKLTQSRFFSSPISKKETKDKTVWSIPVKIGGSASQQVSEFLMNKKEMSIPKPKENNWIKLNFGETALVRIDYTEEYLNELEKAVKNKELSNLDRLGLIRDTFDLARSGGSPTTLALDLVRSYIDEEDYTVWSQITGHLTEVDFLLAHESFYEDFRKFGRQLYSKIADKLGWEKKKGEKHTDSLLRSIALYKLGSFGDKETINKAKEMFRASIVIPAKAGIHTNKFNGSQVKPGMTKKGIDPDLRGVIYNLVAQNGGLTEFNTLVKMYKEESNQQEKDRIGRSLGLFPSKAVLQKSLDFSISKFVRYQNSLQIIASVWGNPKGRYLAWGFVKKNWDLLKERYAGGHYFTRVFGPAGEFTKKQDAKDIEKFVKKHPVPEAKRTIAQVLEQIYANSEWLKRDRVRIKKFLEKE